MEFSAHLTMMLHGRLGLVAFLIVALAFDPIKQRVQKSIDRVFYRDRYNYQRALRDFSRELLGQMNLGQILESMVNRISTTMHVETVAVVICDGREGCRSVGRNVEIADDTFTRTPGGLVGLLEQRKKPVNISTNGPEAETLSLLESDRAKIERSGIVLSVPMFLQNRLIGMINVGPKLSGRMYSQDDVDLLDTVGKICHNRILPPHRCGNASWPPWRSAPVQCRNHSAQS